MNAKSCCLLFAAGLMTATLPGFAAQQNGAAMSGQNQYSQSQNSQQPMQGRREAMKMVPARATFMGTIDSRNAQPGTPVNVKLDKDVQLDNGPKLPKGTVLDGQVVNDTSQSGNARLAVRFTQAHLSSGQTVPIKATIIGIYDTPNPDDNAGYWGSQPGAIPPSWNDGTLAVDQIDALDGIDLHSRIASQSSGVFISKKNDIKLSPGYSMTLAIAEANRGSGSSAMNGTNGNDNSAYRSGTPNSANGNDNGNMKDSAQPPNAYSSH